MDVVSFRLLEEEERFEVFRRLVACGADDAMIGELSQRMELPEALQSFENRKLLQMAQRILDNPDSDYVRFMAPYLEGDVPFNDRYLKEFARYHLKFLVEIFEIPASPSVVIGRVSDTAGACFEARPDLDEFIDYTEIRFPSLADREKRAIWTGTEQSHQGWVAMSTRAKYYQALRFINHEFAHFWQLTLAARVSLYVRESLNDEQKKRFPLLEPDDPLYSAAFLFSYGLSGMQDRAFYRSPNSQVQARLFTDHGDLTIKAERQEAREFYFGQPVERHAYDFADKSTELVHGLSCVFRECRNDLLYSIQDLHNSEEAPYLRLITHLSGSLQREFEQICGQEDKDSPDIGTLVRQSMETNLRCYRQDLEKIRQMRGEAGISVLPEMRMDSPEDYIAIKKYCERSITYFDREPMAKRYEFFRMALFDWAVEKGFDSGPYRPYLRDWQDMDADAVKCEEAPTSNLST